MTYYQIEQFIKSWVEEIINDLEFFLHLIERKGIFVAPDEFSLSDVVKRMGELEKAIEFIREDKKELAEEILRRIK